MVILTHNDLPNHVQSHDDPMVTLRSLQSHDDLPNYHLLLPHYVPMATIPYRIIFPFHGIHLRGAYAGSAFPIFGLLATNAQRC